ncbi:MAG: superoxide dismutase [Candidatus Moraniibacteriota bacterium]|nr:MAG: superoxide dismutase [Candidatus Moranbacteria bacterium]
MYHPKKFEHLLGISGMSEDLLRNHFTLYEGYVANVNKLQDSLIELRRNEKFIVPEYAEMNRRFGWEWNGMRLHELYFGNLTKEKSFLLEGKLKEAFKKEWGSLEVWEKDFRSMAVMRGIGWIVLYYDPQEDQFFNVWINEHDGGHLSGSIPLLVMDVFEHAYMIDYGLKRVDYIEIFMKAIDWRVVESRFVK